VAEARRTRTPAPALRAAELYADALRSAPAVYSLLDDRADALAAAGRPAAAAALRAERRRLDPAGVFAPAPPGR